MGRRLARCQAKRGSKSEMGGGDNAGDGGVGGTRGGRKGELVVGELVGFDTTTAVE